MGMAASGGAKAGAEISVVIGGAIGLALGAVIGVVVGAIVGAVVGAVVGLASYAHLKLEGKKEMSGSHFLYRMLKCHWKSDKYERFFDKCQTGYYSSVRDKTEIVECPTEAVKVPDETRVGAEYE